MVKADVQCPLEIEAFQFSGTFTLTLTPVNMIELEDKQGIQNVLTSYPHTFQGIGKLRDYQVKLHMDHNLKPFAKPPRHIPYNLKSRVDESLTDMLESVKLRITQMVN